MPGSLDEELMRDDPLILLNVRKNLLLGATHYLQLKKSLSVTLHLTTQGCLLDRTGYTGETWKPSPKVVLQPEELNQLQQGSLTYVNAGSIMCHKDNMKNRHTWLYWSCPRYCADVEAAWSSREFWRPTAWVPNSTPSLTTYIPSLCVSIFSAVKEIIIALTDLGCQENEMT